MEHIHLHIHHLHSTIFILKLLEILYILQSYPHLHSTIFILKRYSYRIT